MIGKIIKGRGFRGVLEYALLKEKGKLIWSNLASEEPRGMAQEFGAIRQLKPRLKNAVFHAALSAPKNEKITDQTWVSIALEYLKKMGFVCPQVVLVRHSDTEHDHIHVIANRIGLDGKVVNDSKDFERQEKTLRAIEKQFGLQPLVAPRKSAVRAPTRSEAAKTDRTDEDSNRMLIRGFCEAAVGLSSNLDEYVSQLKRWGVKTTFFTKENKRTLKGITYEFEGFKIASGKLGSDFMPAGLAERGLAYLPKAPAASVAAPVLPQELQEALEQALRHYARLYEPEDPKSLDERWAKWMHRDPRAAVAWCVAWIDGEDAGHIPAEPGQGLRQAQPEDKDRLDMPSPDPDQPDFGR